MDYIYNLAKLGKHMVNNRSSVQNMPTILCVVAAALIDQTGRLMLQRRPTHGVHGGLWEFPGGKVEHGESAAPALARELREELGIIIDPGDLQPIGFADAPLDARNLILLLYCCYRWTGMAAALQPGAQIRWVRPEDAHAQPMPPADRQLRAALLRFLAAGAGPIHTGITGSPTGSKSLT